MEKGKLPVTGFIKIENEIEKWKLNSDNELRITGIIEKEDKIKVRIKITLTKILSPDHRDLVHNSSMIITNIEEKIATNIKKNKDFFRNYLDNKLWILDGFIEGENKIPITINYYESIQIAIYTQQLVEKIIIPEHPSMN